MSMSVPLSSAKPRTTDGDMTNNEPACVYARAHARVCLRSFMTKLLTYF